MKKRDFVELFWMSASILLVLILLVTVFLVIQFTIDQGPVFVAGVMAGSFLIGVIVFKSIKAYLADDVDENGNPDPDKKLYDDGYGDAFHGRSYGYSLVVKNDPVKEKTNGGNKNE